MNDAEAEAAHDKNIAIKPEPARDRLVRGGALADREPPRRARGAARPRFLIRPWIYFCSEIPEMKATLLIIAILGMTDPVLAQNSPQGARGMAAADRDADQSLSREEFSAWRRQQFARADTNTDGYLSAEEIAAGRQSSPTPAQGQNRNADPMRLDTDGDGRLSVAEFDEGSARGFERLDRNSDGRLNAADRAQ